MRIDVLDLGSNTFHLLQAEVAGTHIETVCDRKLWVRLGEDAFVLGRIPEAACERALEAIGALIAPLGGVRPVAVATGVFREADNAGELVAAIRQRFGLDVRVLDGREEAAFVYDGVRGEALDPAARLAVFDLGGGSLDCVVGERGRLEVLESLPLGVLRLAGSSTAEIRARVVGTAGPVIDAITASKPDEVVLAAGTARALYKLAKQLRRTSAVAGCISRSTIRVLAELLHGLTPVELGQLGITSARHDTIAIGARVLATVVELLDVPLVRVANSALREGVALHEAALLARRVA